jgi:hypothetical protein
LPACATSLDLLCGVIGDLPVKKPRADEYPGFAPPRRQRGGGLFTAILLAIGVTCFILFLGPVLLAMALFNGMAQMLAGIGSFVSTISLLAVVLARLLELLWLLQTAQPVQFVIRLLQTFSN